MLRILPLATMDSTLEISTISRVFAFAIFNPARKSRVILYLDVAIDLCYTKRIRRMML